MDLSKKALVPLQGVFVKPLLALLEVCVVNPLTTTLEEAAVRYIYIFVAVFTAVLFVLFLLHLNVHQKCK